MDKLQGEELFTIRSDSVPSTYGISGAGRNMCHVPYMTEESLCIT